MEINRITVFCGSSYGTERIYEEQALQLGKKLAAENIELVYGGANVGLMGKVADGVINNKGRAIGVLPHFLKDKEIAHKNLTELILVETMHQRKKKMDELSDGVIALPGGFGTLEELFEMLTWAQLGLHKKPIAVLNVNGFFDELLLFMKTMVKKGFLKQINFDMLIVSGNIPGLLEKMKNYKAPDVGKWIRKDNV
ncbi:TIGR00730 family Rossman fold protein [Parapedobacter sp. 2B3]|uniref:LOG family protein n=1 Tax=Parapedobacter sp. 2B3 TaxID=3342381 RepID=UPI0035B61F3D